MKQFLLFAATVLVTLGTISQAQAKKPEDQGVPPGNSNPYIRRESRRLPAAQLARRILRTEKGKLLVQARQDTRRQGAGQVHGRRGRKHRIRREDRSPSGRHPLGSPRYRFSPTQGPLSHIPQVGLPEQSQPERHYLLVEDMDNRAGRQYRPPGVEDRIRHPFPRRSRPDRLSVYVGQHHAGGKTASRIAEVLQNMVQKAPKARCAKKRLKRTTRGCWICTTLTSPPRRTNKSAFRDRVNIRRLFHCESLFLTRERGFR